MDFPGILIWKFVNLLYQNEKDYLKKDGMALLGSMCFNEGNKLTYSISATHDIFQALLTLENQLKIQPNIDYCTIMVCSMAIVRFVNNMTDSAQKSTPKRAVHHTALNMNIPKWLVDMRHSIVHCYLTMDQRILEDGLRFCADWLYQKYWCDFTDIDVNNFQHLPTTRTLTEESDLVKLREFVSEAQTYLGDEQDDLLLSKTALIFFKYEYRLVFYELILNDIADEHSTNEILSSDQIWLNTIIKCFPHLIEEFVHFIVDQPHRLFKGTTKSHLTKLKHFIESVIEAMLISDDVHTSEYEKEYMLDVLQANLDEILGYIVKHQIKLFNDVPGIAPFERTRKFIKSIITSIETIRNTYKLRKSPANIEANKNDPQTFIYTNDNKWDKNCVIYPIWNVPLGVCIGPSHLRESFVKFQYETIPLINKGENLNKDNSNLPLVTNKPLKRLISSDIELL